MQARIGEVESNVSARNGEVEVEATASTLNPKSYWRDPALRKRLAQGYHANLPYPLASLGAQLAVHI